MKASKFLAKHGYKFEHLGEKVLFRATLFSRRPDHRTVIIDGLNRNIGLSNRFGFGPKYKFDSIDSIEFTSELFKEHVSANKRSSFEYKKQILIRLHNKKEIPVFTLISEREKKEKQIDQIMDWLKKVLATGQNFSSK